jgi:DNA mismatch endonuclease (patch repair protein)
VLPSRKAVVLVHGCFWHRHPGYRFATMPSTRVELWADKFGKNVERDVRNEDRLHELGWRTFIAWECDIRGDVDAVANDVGRWLRRSPAGRRTG